MTTFLNKKSILSLVMAVMLAFTMFPTSAMAADADIVEDHVHTEECEHDEIIVKTEAVVLDETAITSQEDNPITDITVETEEATITETVLATSGIIGESNVEWNLDTASGRLIFTGNGDCEPFTSADDQPWAAVRTEIKEVWFYDMDSLTISDLAYWFDGCTSLEMAEIPYTTLVIGTRAFANCLSLEVIMIYHDGGFEIEEDAFVVDTPSLLEIRYVPASADTFDILTSYDWLEDNRYVNYEDAYGLMLLATGTCGICKETCEYTLEYEQWDEEEHWVRRWCSNCGKDQLGGVLGQLHTFSNGICTVCGYNNGSGSGSGSGGDSGGGTTTCYHYNTYYSWSGCTYYEYCSNCGEYMGSGTSHGYTYTTWSGCTWYEYCNDCGAYMNSGTSHGSYSYGSWEYYSSSQHRRKYACSDCGEGSYSYGYHSTSTEYTEYSSTQHKVGSYCSTCSSYVGSTSYESHDFSYGSWTKYNNSQHRRSVYCSDCGYSSYEYATHSLSYGSWTSNGSSQHKRTVSCSCGYSTTETASHNLTYGSWTKYSDTQHKRTVSCSTCSYSTTEYANHSLTTGSWSSVSDTQHARTASCSCGYSSTETVNHDFSYGEWEGYNDTQHRRTASCDCGYSGYVYEDHVLTSGADVKQKDDTQHYLVHTCDCGYEVEEAENHTFTYGAWSSISDSEHTREAVCRCGYSTDETAYHEDSDYDGYCDYCEYLMTFFSVTVPANMSLTVSKNGEVYAATNAAVINNSSYAVEITSVTVSAGENWTLVPYGYNMADEKVDSRLIGFYLNGAETSKIGTSESLTLSDNWTIDRDDFFPLQYDAVVSATSDILQNEQVLTLVFIINWAPR